MATSRPSPLPAPVMATVGCRDSALLFIVELPWDLMLSTARHVLMRRRARGRTRSFAGTGRHEQRPQYAPMPPRQKDRQRGDDERERQPVWSKKDMERDDVDDDWREEHERERDHPHEKQCS